MPTGEARDPPRVLPLLPPKHELGNSYSGTARRVIGLNRCVGLEPNRKFRPLLRPPWVSQNLLDSRVRIAMPGLTTLDTAQGLGCSVWPTVALKAQSIRNAHILGKRAQI